MVIVDCFRIIQIFICNFESILLSVFCIKSVDFRETWWCYDSVWKVVCNAWENNSRRKKVKNSSAYYLLKHNHSQSTIILLNVHTKNKIFHIKNRRIEWGRHIKTHIKCCVHMLGNECRTPSVWYEFEWIKAIKKEIPYAFFPIHFGCEMESDFVLPLRRS